MRVLSTAVPQTQNRCPDEASSRPDSPAGRATMPISNVGARPAGEVPNPQECRFITPTLPPTARKRVFKGQQWALSLILLFTGLTTTTFDRIAEARDENTAAGDQEYSAAAFAACSACHLPDGAGIPGAFPPLKNRLAAIASLEGGRDYLITTVSFGLMGTIQVGGMQYFGVMAGNKGAMSAEEIASALNFAVFELADDKDAAGSIPAFSAEEVTSSQSKVSAASPAVAGKLREKMLEQHGDKWPQ